MSNQNKARFSKLLEKWESRIKGVPEKTKFSSTDYAGGLVDAYKNCLAELRDTVVSEIFDELSDVGGQKYKLVEDDSGHHYIIPVEKKGEWYKWLEIGEEDERSCAPPDFARLIKGPHTLVFENWSERY